MKFTFKWLFDAKDWKLMLRSVPSLTVAMFCVSVVAMNLMASKTILITDSAWIGIDGGTLLSWIPFLCMDILNKAYGARVTIKINILALGINLLCVGMFALVAAIQFGGNPAEFEAFNYIFGPAWQILLASSVAFLVSGILNSIVNVGIGKMFEHDPDGKAAYYTRSYVSTIFAQFVDNFIFAFLAFVVFQAAGSGWTLLTVLGSAIFTALLELLMEAIFSPIGYRVCKRWKEESVGKEYMEYLNKSN